jgi:hypothetical protein
MIVFFSTVRRGYQNKIEALQAAKIFHEAEAFLNDPVPSYLWRSWLLDLFLLEFRNDNSCFTSVYIQLMTEAST